MPYHPLGIDRERNPEYFRLVDEYNSLLKEWAEINERLHAFKFNAIFPFLLERKLNVIGVSLIAFQPKFTKWDNNVTSLLMNPKVHFLPNVDEPLTYIHFMTSLRTLQEILTQKVGALMDNFYRCQALVHGQVNFVIAIVSGMASFAGLVVALLTIWFKW